MSTLTQAKRDIAKAKRALVLQAAQKGICENFGQARVRKLEDTYSECRYAQDGVWDAILAFDDWCMNYTGWLGT